MMYLIYVFIAGWLVYALVLIEQAWNKPEKTNTFLLQSVPGVFTTLGVLGTFIGITIGLLNFNTQAIEESIIDLLDGMKVAFLSSIIGISLSLIFSYVIKYIMHEKGGELPVPESEETRMLQAIFTRQEAVTNHQTNQLRAASMQQTKELKGMLLLQQQALADMSQALVDNNSETTQQMLKGLKSTNEKVVKNLDKNHKLMREKFDEFAKLLADANTDALREAMESLVKDFNDTFKNLIKGLIDQNFEELNKSVKALNDWQEQHREEMDKLHQSLTKNIEQLTGLGTKLETTYTKMETSLANSSSSLENITTQTEQLVADDGKLAKIVEALNQVLVEENKLTQAFDMAVRSMRTLLAGTQEFETVKKQITEWLSQEKGIQEAMTTFNGAIETLNTRLEELDGIKMHDLTLLDNSFDTRLQAALNTSFANLDKLIREYVKFLENNRKIEIKVTNP